MKRTRKRCKDCNSVLVLEQFPPHPEMKDGRENSCRGCSSARSSAWRAANRERYRATSRRRYAERTSGEPNERNALLKSGKQRCTTCGVAQDIDEFQRTKRNKVGRLRRCRRCKRARCAMWRRDRRKRSCTAREAEGWHDMKRTYGLSQVDYDAILGQQGGVCAICLRPEDKTYHGRVMRLQVDHCHSTGVIRGLLCRVCNSGMGLMRDDPERLAAAADYLRSRTTDVREALSCAVMGPRVA